MGGVDWLIDQGVYLDANVFVYAVDSDVLLSNDQKLRVPGGIELRALG